MNKQEFSRALEAAKSDECFLDVDDSLLFGCGLVDFEPVHCSTKQVAKLIRYQAQYLNGNWDWNEINDLARIARKKFIILE